MERVFLSPEHAGIIQQHQLGSAEKPVPRRGPFSRRLSNMKGVYIADFRTPMPKDYFGDWTLLQGLNKGTSISINWQKDATSEPHVLIAKFPHRIAMHFSDAWAMLFPYLPGYSTREIRKLHPKTITIVGGKAQYHLEVLQWMLNCTKGSGLKVWEHYAITDKPFYRYYNLRRSAQIIGCIFLKSEFHLRMQAVSNKRIHSDDIAALWAEIPHPSEMAEHLAAHVASFFVNGDKNIVFYMRLREAYPDFNEAVIAKIGFRHDHDAELARAWNSRILAKDEVNADNEVKEETASEAIEKATEATKEETVRDAKEVVNEAAKKEAGVEELELARERASKIKDQNGRRREKKRLAKLARSLAAE